jgi:hypothetical protein
MSSLSAKKTKHLPSEGRWPGGASDQAAEDKEIGSTVPECSFLLSTQPDILRKDYSCLTVKEALVLHRTHRQYNEASNYYPFLCSYNIMNDAGLNMLGFTDYDFIDEYMEKQKEALLFLITKTCGHVYKSYLSHHGLMTTCLTKRKIMW